MTSLWRIEDGNLIQLDSDALKLEKNIHDRVEQNPSMLDSDLMIIGREAPTSDNKRIDLLGLDSDGALIVVEMKKGQTPRQVVTQVLEYAAWVDTLEDASANRNR